MYFKPKDEDDFRRQLLRMIGDDDEASNLRADLVARGKERVKLFSWKKCANETAEVYQQAIKEFGATTKELLRLADWRSGNLQR